MQAESSLVDATPVSLIRVSMNENNKNNKSNKLFLWANSIPPENPQVSGLIEKSEDGLQKSQKYLGHIKNSFESVLHYGR